MQLWKGRFSPKAQTLSRRRGEKMKTYEEVLERIRSCNPVDEYSYGFRDALLWVVGFESIMKVKK